jgi:hypothetical protein
VKVDAIAVAAKKRRRFMGPDEAESTLECERFISGLGWFILVL